MKGKYKYSDKDKKFSINSNSNTRGENFKLFGDFKIRSKSREELDVLYLEYAKKVNERYENIIKKHTSKSIDYDRYIDLKRCEECKDFENDRAFVLCEHCEDGYHIYCLKPKLTKIPDCDFICSNCEISKQKNNNGFQGKISFKIEKKRIQKKCNKCTLNINDQGENNVRSKSNESANRSSNCKQNRKEIHSAVNNMIAENSLKTCIKCQKDFHLKCFRKDWEDMIMTVTPELDKSFMEAKKNYSKKLTKNKMKIICDNCESSIFNTLKLTKISDYFKPKKNTSGSNRKLMSNNYKTISNPNEKFLKNYDQNSEDLYDRFSADSECKNQLKSSSSLINKKDEAMFRLPKALKKEQKKILQESIFRAMNAKGIEFDDDLCYPDPQCPPQLNDANKEIGIQLISDYNKKIYYKFKLKTKIAEYAPLVIIDDHLQGFIVKANDNIPPLTLICEYSGDVHLARNKVFDKNDSIMDLIRAPSCSNSLVICPEKKSNIARFISGINNHNKKGIKKQNVKSIRYNIDGQVHVILYSSKRIKKNDVLYYDYNAGGHDGYPTELFE